MKKITVLVLSVWFLSSISYAHADFVYKSGYDFVGDAATLSYYNDNCEEGDDDACKKSEDKQLEMAIKTTLTFLDLLLSDDEEKDKSK